MYRHMQGCTRGHQDFRLGDFKQLGERLFRSPEVEDISGVSPFVENPNTKYERMLGFRALSPKP